MLTKISRCPFWSDRFTRHLQCWSFPVTNQHVRVSTAGIPHKTHHSALRRFGSFNTLLSWDSNYPHWNTGAASRRISGINNQDKPILTLFTKEDCSLCDEAMEILVPYLDQVVLQKVDITLPENRELYKIYRYEIPVFHLNGQFLMKHRADLQLFKEKLNNFLVTSNKI